MAKSATENQREKSDKETVRPEHQHYDTLEKHLRAEVSDGIEYFFDPHLFDKELRRLWETYDVPYELLQSFVRNIHLSHVKKTSSKVRSSLPSLLKDYTNGSSIKDLARSVNYPPYLLARYVVEAVAGLQNQKKSLAKAMRDPELYLGTLDSKADDYQASEDSNLNGLTRLAKQVREAIDCDPIYGPMHDKERHLVGVEYEVVLEFELKRLGLPFETEAELRQRGTSRTPDVLLSLPLGIEVPAKNGETEWKIICWIDSKALFGDVQTHHTSVLPQAESYVHRFGPGVVLYWFGHAPVQRLGDAQGDVVVVGWELPNRFMLPTGKMLPGSI